MRVEKISAVIRFLYCNMCGMLCVRTMVDNDEERVVVSLTYNEETCDT